MSGKFTFIILSFLSIQLSAQTKTVCFTIDDLPTVSYGHGDSAFQISITKRIVDAVVRHKIPAIGFVNEFKLYGESGLIPWQVSMLNYWVDNGLELGNHNYSHPDFNNTSIEKYTDGILQGEKITKSVLKRKNLTMRYFRHPFLHVGNHKAKADSLEDFLKRHNYTVAPVTIDDEDYVFAAAYGTAFDKRDTSMMSRIGKDYIYYMEQKVKFYERQSQKLFNRNIAQTLLIHASLLNAVYMEKLAIMFERNNYKFVSLDTALKDIAYKSDVTAYGNWGISWLDRWAMSRHVNKEFFKDEPETPAYVTALSKEEN